MKSFATLSREIIRKLILALDYIFWLIFDFSKFKQIKKEKIKKILVIHLGAIGELIVTTPLIAALNEEFNSKITFMLTSGKEQIFKNNPRVNKCIYLVRGFFNQIQALRKENFDLVVILYPGSFKLALICFLAGIKYRIGCFASVKGIPLILFNRRTFPFSNKEVIPKTLDILTKIGIKNSSPNVEIYVSKKEQDELQKRLKKLKIKNYAIIHPSFSSSSDNKYPSRLWPLKRYAEIADYVSTKYNLVVFITGSPGEIALAEEIKRNCKSKRVIIANDLFNLRDLMALISKAKLMVSCGTGLVHIAGAFNIRAVIFEGKGDPIEWKPFYTKKEKLRFLFHPEVCTQCNRESCRRKDIQCMNAITIEEVKDAIDSLMK